MRGGSSTRAGSFAMTKRPHVALIVETSTAYGRRVLKGITHYVRSHQPWSIFLEQRALTTKPPAWLEGWKGDGIISRATDRRLAEALTRSKIPVVDLTDRHGDAGFPLIRSDDEAIGRLAAEHLLGRGFRRLAFCGFARESWSKRRLAAFADAAREAGASCDRFETPWFGSDVSWEEEQDLLTAWLRDLPRPVGVMACNDVRGQHVIDACARIGLAVPEEVAVIGVDDDELLCDLCDPPLSSVIANPQRVGYLAAELLDALIHGKQPPARVQMVEPLGIATRQSTDIAAIDDPDIALAVKLIRENACKGLNLDELLAAVPLSRSILERRLRKHLGLSPLGLIRQTQIKRIQQLLVETDLPLEQIGPLAGFKHAEHMCVVFKREVGQTPGTYRRQTRG
jgi:LacI family transcriptional regulator